MTSVKLSSLIPPKFHSVWRASLNQNILHVVCEGGRGSGKSSDVAHIIIQLIMRYAVNDTTVLSTEYLQICRRAELVIYSPCRRQLIIHRVSCIKVKTIICVYNALFG